MSETKPTEKGAHRLPDKKTVFGAFVLFFAVIGVISTIIFIVNESISLVENRKGKDEFASYIAPLVVIDPPTFDSVDKLDSKTVLTAAVWNLLKNEKLSKYEMDDFQFITVPKTDVEAYAIKLFGEGVKLEHQPLGDAYYSFSYNATEGTYLIPTTNVYVPYTPEITDIKRNGDIYTLTVDYVSTNNFLNQEKEENKKTRLYTLKKIGKKAYNIISVSDPKRTALSSAAATVSETVSQASVSSSIPLSSEASVSSWTAVSSLGAVSSAAASK